MSNWLQRWSLGSRIRSLSAGVTVLLCLIAGSAAYTATVNRNRTLHLIDNINPALTASERLLSLAIGQQSAVRQYAGSGDQRLLDDYRQQVADERTLATSAERFLRSEPQLRDQMHAARAKLLSWQAEVAEPLMTTTQANGANPELATPDPAGRARFEDVTATITTYRRAMLARQNALRDGLRRTTATLITLLTAAGVVVLLAGVILAIGLHRLVIRPVVAMAGEVRRVAGGDYGYEISTVGPPEIESLANHVNAMRRQISADLQEVLAARRTIEDVNQQLEAQAAELTRSNRDLEQFAYVASHDLQEPLRKVASFCQLLQRRYAGQLDERADQYIHFAVDGAQRMQRLINDLLAFSRIGRVTAGFVEVDLDKVVDEVIGQREPTGGSITRDQLPTVRGEEPLLAALLNNLVGNSLKFRRPDVPVRVHIAATQRDEEWEFAVRDNGIGISPEFVDKVFVIFQRLHSREAYPGTGIGLSICKKIVEYHGGRIWIDTEYQDGTLIRFTLPVIPAQEPTS